MLKRTKALIALAIPTIVRSWYSLMFFAKTTHEINAIYYIILYKCVWPANLSLRQYRNIKIMPIILKGECGESIRTPH